jgi:sulfatase modifying factor 1
MRGMRIILIVGLICASSASAATVTFGWAAVGDTGNPSEPTTARGAVGYAYQITRHEVTNGQYVQFLNSKAASDPLGLYDPGMTNDACGGITRSGSAGSYAYAVKSGYENKPVVFVDWYDAVRFANWVNNAQGNGDTETGAYTLVGGTPIPSNPNSIARNPGANVVLPSENEWYKAAYYQPATAGGDSDGYWLYPTGSNDPMVSDQPPGPAGLQHKAGNFVYNDGIANGYDDGYAVTGSGDFPANGLTNVGAYAAADSFYGTFDQGGNVWEWCDTLTSGSDRVLRGGSWSVQPQFLRSDDLSHTDPRNFGFGFGFRLASIPEPSGLGMIAVGAMRLLRRMRRA